MTTQHKVNEWLQVGMDQPGKTVLTAVAQAVSELGLSALLCTVWEHSAPRKPALAQHAPDASALSQVAKVILSTKQYRI